MKAFGLVLLLMGHALAAPPYVPCGDVPEQGRCETPTKVVWCEDKAQKSLDCTAGTLCAWNELISSFDCVEASCEDVPTTGHCLNATTVAWCEDGVVQTLMCAAGTDCGWNDEVGTFDCVKVTPMDPSDDTVEYASDANNDNADAGTDSGTTSDSGYVPSPHVQDSLDLDTSGPSSSKDGGCSITHQPNPVASLILCGFLVLACGVRRRIA